jgi:hypothetical protein
MQDHGQTLEQGPLYMDSSGFVCPSCSFRFLLSDENVSREIVDSLHAGAATVRLTCPECEVERSFTRNDLKVFGAHGKETSMRKTRSAFA